MKMNISGNHTNSTNKTITAAILGVVFAGIIVATSATAAGASSECGEYSFGFAGTLLLNDGISGSAGPFLIELPAGTYDVTLRSFDAHDEHPGQVEQTEEQWYVALDSGWVSGFTNDIPDESNHSTTVLGSQEIEQSNAISVHHRGVGNINSVEVVCVGFTTVLTEPAPVEVAAENVEITPVDESVEAPVETPTTPTTAVPTAVPAAEIPEPAPESPAVAAPVPVVAEVAGAVEELPAQLPPTVSLTRAPTMVLAQVETAPMLALTGPSTTTLALALGGLLLITLGASMVVLEKRVAAG
ncbi:MAG: hypothetical protein ACR2P0_09905 [Acidimicrobiales bacterium]